MKIVLKSNNNAHYAEAEYSSEKITVLVGSKINMIESYPKMPADVKLLRADRSVVDEDGNVIKEASFTSPSAAAQFVTGRSVNGFVSWRPNDEMSLKQYLEKNTK